MPNDSSTPDVATGITNLTSLHQYLGVLWVLAICAADPDALKKLTDGSPAHLDFLRYDAEHRPFISDYEACEKYLKEHAKKILEKQGMNIKNCCTFAPDCAVREYPPYLDYPLKPKEE